MSHSERLRSVKVAQKEATIRREISRLFMELCMDEPSLHDLFINRVQLSPDKSLCTIFFYSAGGIKAFKEKLPTLILYKPSMRHALAQKLSARYTPELRFAFDELFEKHQRIETILESIKEETKKTE